MAAFNVINVIFTVTNIIVNFLKGKVFLFMILRNCITNVPTIQCDFFTKNNIDQW